jgi:ribosomal protein S18 acetylase RimI-like enzyme
MKPLAKRIRKALSRKKALWTAVFAYPAPHNEPTRVIRDKPAVQPELFFVALLDGVLVGTVLGGYDGHRWWLYSLAVSPQARRQGIGTGLMHHLESELAVQGCPKVNLQVLASNAETIEFYKKLGYSVEERISMGKLLPPLLTEWMAGRMLPEPGDNDVRPAVVIGA